jgi:hypothetical protein
MSIELARRFLLGCTVINYGILLVWFLVFMLAHDWMRGLHGRILLFNLVPLVALWIVG